jgi:hypothetical protein
VTVVVLGEHPLPSHRTYRNFYLSQVVRYTGVTLPPPYSLPWLS